MPSFRERNPPKTLHKPRIVLPPPYRVHDQGADRAAYCQVLVPAVAFEPAVLVRVQPKDNPARAIHLPAGDFAVFLRYLVRRALYVLVGSGLESILGHIPP